MSRFTARYRKVSERDRLFIMGLDLKLLDRLVLPLYAGFGISEPAHAAAVAGLDVPEVTVTGTMLEVDAG